MLAQFFRFHNCQLTMSHSDCRIVTFKSVGRYVLEAWDGYSKTKVKLMFKRSD